MEARINELIGQYHRTETDAKRALIKNDIHRAYYQASASERAAVEPTMRPFLDEIEQEMIQKDPLAREAFDLLNRPKLTKISVAD